MIPLKRYKLIAVCSFLILFFILLYLIYNTYELKDREYFADEKALFIREYHKLTAGDLIYPGGLQTFSDILWSEEDNLKQAYLTDSANFNFGKQLICNKLFGALRASGKLDSVFKQIFKKETPENGYRYLFTVFKIDIVYSPSITASLYDASFHYPLIPDSIQSQNGVIIGGNLPNPDSKNNIMTAEISPASPPFPKYDIGIRLYIDNRSHCFSVLWNMMPIFILSIIVITIIIILYYLTYRNWFAQKNIADIKSDFIDNITHEFNTPLSTIMIANKNIQNEANISNNEKIFTTSKVIERHSRLLKMLFEQAFYINAISDLLLDKKEFYLLELLEELITDYHLSLSHKNVNIVLFREREDIVISLDKFLFTSIIFNILQNAVKYNTNEIKKIQLYVVDIDAAVQIRIKDNGIGMNEDTLQHIFEKSYRNHNEKFPQPKGLGFGLYYSKKCVEAHGWNIYAESKSNDGSCFIIDIPLK